MKTDGSDNSIAMQGRGPLATAGLIRLLSTLTTTIDHDRFQGQMKALQRWSGTSLQAAAHGPSEPAHKDQSLEQPGGTKTGIIESVFRNVVPGLPRGRTFQRQPFEKRDRLEPLHFTAAERRAVSMDRRVQSSNSPLNNPGPAEWETEIVKLHLDKCADGQSKAMKDDGTNISNFSPTSSEDEDEDEDRVEDDDQQPTDEIEIQSVFSNLLPSLTAGSTISSSLTPGLIEDIKSDVFTILTKDEDFRGLFRETPERIPHERFQRNFLRLFRLFLSDIRKQSGDGEQVLHQVIRVLKYQSRNIVSHICHEIFDLKA